MTETKLVRESREARERLARDLAALLKALRR